MIKTLFILLLQIASYYNDSFIGKKTASGELFYNSEFTVAHKTLPFGTKLKVTNKANNKSVIVRVNDRGPFIKGRSLDLSQKAFNQISSLKVGTIRVDYEIVDNKEEKSKIAQTITLHIKKQNTLYLFGNVFER